MKTTRTFSKLVKAWDRYPRMIDSEGGTRSGKTYSILQLLSIYLPRTETPQLYSVVSESLPHLKRGCIRDFKDIMRADGMWDEDAWNATDHIYTFGNGSIIEFFGADNAGKVHGSQRDGLFINECQNIDYEIARQLFVRTADRIILDYNPTHEFWVQTKIKPRKDVVSIHSTYKDNTCLSPMQVAEIESNRSDKQWWRVYGEGKVGQLIGLIYNFEQIDEMPEVGNLKEVYGMDFGFTNDPTAIVRILADTKRKILYLQEVCYETHMLNSDIINRLKDRKVERHIPIYADCAEPKSIAEIRKAGFNIKPCDKSGSGRSDKLKFQIQFVQGWKMMVTKDSLNLIKEGRNYTWALDKDDKPTNYPIDKFNHILDATRYGVYTGFASEKGNCAITIFNRR